MFVVHLEVLYTWNNQYGMAVGDLITQMVAWQQNRYLDPGVWEHIRSRINPAALPTNISTLPLPVPPSCSQTMPLPIIVS